MKYDIDPGRAHKPLTMLEGIVYSHVTDLNGNPMELHMSMVTNQMPKRDGSDADEKRPTLIWVNGGGWHTTAAMQNMQVPEFLFLADAGYNVVTFHYRNSSEAKFPAQIIDLKTAIRFLKVHAGKYGVDPERIGVFGRSAGGHLTSFAAMNTDDFVSEEWSGVDPTIVCAIDMFGPVDLPACTRINLERIKEPGSMWTDIGQVHEAALVGYDGNVEHLLEAGAKASPVNYITDAMCPILIMHGDSDPLVPYQISVDFYQKLCDMGYGDKTDLYMLKNAGHGSPEFFQPSVKEIILAFFDKHLKA